MANKDLLVLDLDLSAALATVGPSHLLTAFLYLVSRTSRSPPLALSSLTSLFLSFLSADFPSFRLLNAHVAPGSFYIIFLR